MAVTRLGDSAERAGCRCILIDVADHGDRVKRILVIGPTPPPHHGVATAIELLLQSEVSRKYQLIHLDTADRRGLGNIGRLDVGNVTLAFRHAIQFLRLLLKHRPHAIYLPLSQHRLAFLRDCLFLLPAVALGLPVIAHVHGGRMGHFLDTTDPVTRALARLLLRFTDVIVLGESMRSTVEGYVGSKHVHVVPNGLPDPGIVMRQASGKTRVLYLGTLLESKGYADVLTAANGFRGRTDVEFVFAGEVLTESTRQQMQSVEAELGGLVRYAGVVVGEEKRELLQSSDIFVFPTSYEFEGHPYVLLEAMAASLAIITTDHATIGETVRDGVEAVIVEKHSPQQIVQAIEALIRDPERRRELGSNARARYVERYSSARWGAAILRVFEQACPSRSQSEVVAPLREPSVQ